MCNVCLSNVYSSNTTEVSTLLLAKSLMFARVSAKDLICLHWQFEGLHANLVSESRV